jgi:hypothetical protein
MAEAEMPVAGYRSQVSRDGRGEGFRIRLVAPAIGCGVASKVLGKGARGGLDDVTTFDQIRRRPQHGPAIGWREWRLGTEIDGKQRRGGEHHARTRPSQPEHGVSLVAVGRASRGRPSASAL